MLEQELALKGAYRVDRDRTPRRLEESVERAERARPDERPQGRAPVQPVEFNAGDGAVERRQAQPGEGLERLDPLLAPPVRGLEAETPGLHVGVGDVVDGAVLQDQPELVAGEPAEHIATAVIARTNAMIMKRSARLRLR